MCCIQWDLGRCGCTLHSDVLDHVFWPKEIHRCVVVLFVLYHKDDLPASSSIPGIIRLIRAYWIVCIGCDIISYDRPFDCPIICRDNCALCYYFHRHLQQCLIQSSSLAFVTPYLLIIASNEIHKMGNIDEEKFT